MRDSSALALAALGWILSENGRAERFLALTGLTPDRLRSGLEDPFVLNGVFEFLAAHEPDLLAASESLGIGPAELAAAGRELGQ